MSASRSSRLSPPRKREKRPPARGIPALYPASPLTWKTWVNSTWTGLGVPSAAAAPTELTPEDRHLLERDLAEARLYAEIIDERAGVRLAVHARVERCRRLGDDSLLAVGCLQLQAFDHAPVRRHLERERAPEEARAEDGRRAARHTVCDAKSCNHLQRLLAERIPVLRRHRDGGNGGETKRRFGRVHLHLPCRGVLGYPTTCAARSRPSRRPRRAR